jgi:hypothetical protein
VLAFIHTADMVEAMGLWPRTTREFTFVGGILESFVLKR